MPRQSAQSRLTWLKEHLAITKRRERNAEHPDAKTYHQLRIRQIDREMAVLRREIARK